MEPTIVEDAARPAAGRGRLAPLLLLGPIWLATAVTAPPLGFEIFDAAWGGGVLAGLLALAFGLVVLTLVIGLASYPGRVLTRSDGTWSSRLRWAAGVCLLGTVGLPVGLYFQHTDPGLLGSGTDPIWLTGVPYAFAAAARSRPRALRIGALGTFGAVAALALVAYATAAHSAAGPGQRAQAQPEPKSVIPRRLMLVGDTPSGYRPMAGQISSGQGPDTDFIADYTCASGCPAQQGSGQAAQIIFTAADQSGQGDFSSYTALCGPGSTSGYTCTDLGTDMWRAVTPADLLTDQIIIFEHDEIEFTLEAPRTMDPQVLRAYMQSIHPASNAELSSFLQGYPNYS
jgi:hypothetical protein